jgi:hypothetical protein
MWSRQGPSINKLAAKYGEGIAGQPPLHLVLLNRPNFQADGQTCGRLAYLNTAASNTVTNSTAELAFNTNHTIPANSLRPGT